MTLNTWRPAWRTSSAEQGRFSTRIQHFDSKPFHVVSRRGFYDIINAMARYGHDAPGEIAPPVVDGLSRT
jgi:hypothetical protein